jgi:hypothetical protein
MVNYRLAQNLKLLGNGELNHLTIILTNSTLSIEVVEEYNQDRT